MISKSHFCISVHKEVSLIDEESPFKKSQALHRKSILLGFKHDCNQDKVGSDLVNATVSEFIQVNLLN